jgi:hypothetical protein
VQLSRRLSDFDTKRVELMMTMHERTKDLRAAAQGDTKVVAINAAQQLFVAQVELANLAKREFDELSKGVPPDRLARLAVYLHEFDRRIGKMARQIRERGRMMGPPGAPMGGTPPPDWDDE